MNVAVWPSRRSISLVKYPCFGSRSAIHVVTGVSVPAAQLGTHPWMLLVPLPVARVSVHRDTAAR